MVSVSNTTYGPLAAHTQSDTGVVVDLLILRFQ